MSEDILLDLTTTRKRQKIAIDGVQYELAAVEDFELAEYMWLARSGGRISELMRTEEPEEKDLLEIEQLLDKVTRKMVRNVPDEVMDRLADNQKLSITNVFLDAAQRSGGLWRRRDSKSSSPGSNDSTAAQSKAGTGHASAT